MIMKIITFKDAVHALNECSAVIWNDNFLCYPELIDDEEEENFLHLFTSDEEGQDYEAFFPTKDNQEVKVDGSSMFLIDNEGDEVQLTLLVPANLSGGTLDNKECSYCGSGIFDEKDESI